MGQADAVTVIQQALLTVIEASKGGFSSEQEQKVAAVKTDKRIRTIVFMRTFKILTPFYQNYCASNSCKNMAAAPKEMAWSPKYPNRLKRMLVSPK
jgi:hypothetical protein